MIRQNLKKIFIEMHFLFLLLYFFAILTITLISSFFFFLVVEGLVLLQETFSVLQEWTGDPCLPLSYTWDWVNCSSDDIPRVTAL